MRTSLLLSMLLLASLAIPCAAQTSSQKYERGTIAAVTRHQSGADDEDATARYDVSVKVRDTMYVVLYEPPNGANSVEYAAGMDLLVLVADDALTFPSKLTGTTRVPILRKEALAPEPILDWSKAPSQYFEMKMKNLTQSLDLSSDQQAKIKPIVEQEAGESSQFCFTTSIPLDDRLKRWEKVVRSSDEKMKPVLTQAQWDKLQEMRKGQKKELKALIEKQQSASSK